MKSLNVAPRFGYLLWSSLILMTFVFGFVFGWQSSNGWLRAERDDLQEKVERQRHQLNVLNSKIERAKRRLDTLTN